MNGPQPELVVWGTYDLGKPRVRIILRGLHESGVRLTEIHRNVWEGIEDKSQLRGFATRLRRLLRWLFSYPALIFSFLRAPRHPNVFIPYLGHMDVLVLWPFARLRGCRIHWDVFIPLYNTLVEDRRLLSRRNPMAWVVYGFEALAAHAADRVILDTQSHADYFARCYRLPRNKVTSLLVGVEQERFPPLPPLPHRPPGTPLSVLFYGQFIPLHGIRTIVRAAAMVDDGSVHWVLIGKGQDEQAIRDQLALIPVTHLEWHPWVPYAELIEWIERADVCLGIFGDSEKSARVIPNKVFQVISAGRPLITRDSPAIRELLRPDMPGVSLVPPADADALAAAVRAFAKGQQKLYGVHLHANIRPCITPRAIGNHLAEITCDPNQTDRQTNHPTTETGDRP